MLDVSEFLTEASWESSLGTPADADAPRGERELGRVSGGTDLPRFFDLSLAFAMVRGKRGEFRG